VFFNKGSLQLLFAFSFSFGDVGDDGKRKTGDNFTMCEFAGKNVLIEKLSAVIFYLLTLAN
jgi:hypothetical protein